MLGDEVVGVDEGQIVSMGDVDAGITGIAESTVDFMDDSDALILCSPVVAHLWASVRRSVIHEYQFKVFIILCDHALDTSVKRSLHTIDRDDDTQFHGYKDTNLF